MVLGDTQPSSEPPKLEETMVMKGPMNLQKEDGLESSTDTTNAKSAHIEEPEIRISNETRDSSLDQLAKKPRISSEETEV